MIEYVKLFQAGDSTIPARLQLLTDQRGILLEQRRQIDATLDRLNYKIIFVKSSHVETAVLMSKK